MSIIDQVEKFNNLSIKDYIFFEETGDIDLLKLQSSKKLNSDISEILKKIELKLYEGNKNLISKKNYEIKAKYHIDLMISLYQASSELKIYNDTNKWKIQIGRKTTKLDNLIEYVNDLKKSIGIKDPVNLNNLKNKIQNWTEEFYKNFSEHSSKKLTLSIIMLGVFAKMKMDLDYNMKLCDFLKIKKLSKM